MSTPHNQAEKGDIASVVLMPGDPLRAQYIAQTYLNDPKCFNSVRNMLGYTGTYKEKPISVMGSGMGIPSIGIYSYELYTHYGVDTIIRIGSAGGYSADLHAMDIILAEDAYSESTYAYTVSQTEARIMKPDARINDHIKKTAEKLCIPLKEVRIHSSDSFYSQNDIAKKEAERNGCKAVEMESFGLFHNADILGKKAVCLCTVSDSFVWDEVLTYEMRRNSFNEMIKLALEAAVTL